MGNSESEKLLLVGSIAHLQCLGFSVVLFLQLCISLANIHGLYFISSGAY